MHIYTEHVVLFFFFLFPAPLTPSQSAVTCDKYTAQ